MAFPAEEGDMPVDLGIARGGEDKLTTVQIFVTEGPLLETDAGLLQQRTQFCGRGFHVQGQDRGRCAMQQALQFATADAPQTGYKAVQAAQVQKKGIEIFFRRFVRHGQRS